MTEKRADVEGFAAMFARRTSVEQVEEGRELAPKFDAEGLIPVVTTDAEPHLVDIGAHPLAQLGHGVGDADRGDGQRGAPAYSLAHRGIRTFVRHDDSDADGAFARRRNRL